MPRVADIYSRPAGIDATPNQTIESADYNLNVADVETDLNLPRPIVAGGTGASSAVGARDNLDAERSAQVVTNFDTHVFEAGSFYAAPGATASPAPSRYISGICHFVNANVSMILEAWAYDGTIPSVVAKFYRVKWSTWSSWMQDSPNSSDTADMSFGLSGVAPTSFFYVNSESDLSGTPNIIQANKDKTISFGGPITASSKGHTIGVNGGTLASGAVVPADANFKFYDAGSGNWAGMGSDVNGNVWLRTGTAGTPLTAFYVTNTGTVALNGGLQVIGTTTMSNPLTVTVKGSRFGTTGGTLSSGAVTSADANIKLYDAGTDSWCGMGVDANGDFWLRTGTSGTPAPQFVVQAAGNAIFGASPVAVRAAAGANGAYRVIDESSVIRAQFSWSRSLDAVQTVHSVSAKAINLYVTGAVEIGVGFISRPGIAGVLGNAVNNLNWNTSVLEAWVDTTKFGNLAVTSDYRIKKDVADLPGMWDVVKAMRPISYTQAQYTPQHEIEYKLKVAQDAREAGLDTPEAKPGSELQPMFVADDIERWGFVAHELQETLLPTAASGVKDAPEEIQSLNLAPIIAALTKALQEAMARIEALEAARQHHELEHSPVGEFGIDRVPAEGRWVFEEARVIEPCPGGRVNQVKRVTDTHLGRVRQTVTNTDACLE